MNTTTIAKPAKAAITVLTEKTFSTARAMAALAVYKLMGIDPADGAVLYLLEHHGLVRQVQDVGQL